MHEIVNVPLENLRYRWEHERFEKTNAIVIKLAHFKKWEEKMSHAPKNLRDIQTSIYENGLKKLLIIKRDSYDRTFDSNNELLYVVVGNQRLCCLKSLSDIELKKVLGDFGVPCLVLDEEDVWGDSIKNEINNDELNIG